MNIGVGINENVVIKAAVINDKKRLELELIEATKVGAVKKSVFDTMLTARTSEESTSFKLNIFGPLLPKKEDQSTEKKIELIGNDFTKIVKQLSQILEQFIPVDSIDLDSLDIQFANTGIVDDSTLQARMLDQDVINRIYDNISTRFVALINPFVGSADNAVRFKLIRQSKDKHYASIPGKFISDNPFIELMTVPADQSRVKFTKYELEQGLDNGTPIASDKAEVKQTAAAEVNPFAPQ